MTINKINIQKHLSLLTRDFFSLMGKDNNIDMQAVHKQMIKLVFQQLKINNQLNDHSDELISLISEQITDNKYKNLSADLCYAIISVKKDLLISYYKEKIRRFNVVLSLDLENINFKQQIQKWQLILNCANSGKWDKIMKLV